MYIQYVSTYTVRVVARSVSRPAPGHVSTGASYQPRIQLYGLALGRPAPPPVGAFDGCMCRVHGHPAPHLLAAGILAPTDGPFPHDLPVVATQITTLGGIGFDALDRSGRFMGRFRAFSGRLVDAHRLLRGAATVVRCRVGRVHPLHLHLQRFLRALQTLS